MIKIDKSQYNIEKIQITDDTNKCQKQNLGFKIVFVNVGLVVYITYNFVMFPGLRLKNHRFTSAIIPI